MSEHPTTGTLDPRFSQDEADAATWPDVENRLRAAELYWVTTVRADSRPHTTPLVGVWHEGAFWFCTGRREQKHRNLTAHPGVTVTTGSNTWHSGTDVIVEGDAERITGVDTLSAVAAAYLDKYGEDWRFDAHEDGFGGQDDPGGPADVFRVQPSKVLVFAKAPHGQTTFRF
jgi:nitroimidazol reductase NimA-like FMN-containing flavoprotein (pyridoxamine 5'-phosphate oxidase superfamily)